MAIRWLGLMGMEGNSVYEQKGLFTHLREAYAQFRVEQRAAAPELCASAPVVAATAHGVGGDFSVVKGVHIFSAASTGFEARCGHWQVGSPIIWPVETSVDWMAVGHRQRLKPHFSHAGAHRWAR